MRQIFNRGIVYNELKGIKIKSEILNEKMKEAFVELIPTWTKFSFDVLFSLRNLLLKTLDRIIF